MTTSQADRQMKFRAWDTVNEEMIQLEFWINNSGVLVRVDDGKEMIEPAFEQEQFKIMRLTGLPSKSGKDVYEGDIVKYGTPYHGKITTVLTGFITYNSFCGAFQIAYKNINNSFVTDFAHRFTIIDVIGNIYANSNLLQG